MHEAIEQSKPYQTSHIEQVYDITVWNYELWNISHSKIIIVFGFVITIHFVIPLDKAFCSIALVLLYCPVHPADIFYKCREIDNLKRKHMCMRCAYVHVAYHPALDCLQSYSILQPVIHADVSLTPSFLLDQLPCFNDVCLTRLSLGMDISLLAAHYDVETGLLLSEAAQKHHVFYKSVHC